MSYIAGIDYSTHAIDVVVIDEEEKAAAIWMRHELKGADAFDRARAIRRFGEPHWWNFTEDCVAIGIEDPRGFNTGPLFRIQGAILTRLPARTLVQPWIPSQWRKAVGLPGNATKDAVQQWAINQPGWNHSRNDWPQDACDAYCIALATRGAIQVGAAA